MSPAADERLTIARPYKAQEEAIATHRKRQIAKSPSRLLRKGFRCYCNILVPKVGLEPTRF